MSTMHICLKTPSLAALSLGLGLGCTVDESGGSGGGKPCPDVTISSSALSSSSTGFSAPFTPPSTGAGVGDGWLEYPDCPPGVAWLRGWDDAPPTFPSSPPRAEVKIAFTKIDFDVYGYLRLDGASDDFVLLSWATRVTSNPYVTRYVEGKPGDILQVTGGWRRPDQSQILPIEPGSTVTFSVDPSTGDADLFYFHIYLYPGSEYVGCLRP